MATHSNILVWRTLWTEEPGALQFMEPQESDTTEQLTHTQTTDKGAESKMTKEKEGMTTYTKTLLKIVSQRVNCNAGSLNLSILAL